MAEYKGSSVVDAGFLAVAQALEHYEVSRYGAHKIPRAQDLGQRAWTCPRREAA
jgi:ferritin-like metal-binding protein YciE